MRVVLLRDYREHKAGASLVVPTNEGDWLIRTDIACDPMDYSRIKNKRVTPETVEVPKLDPPKSFGDPLKIAPEVVVESVNVARKAVKKATGGKE